MTKHRLKGSAKSLETHIDPEKEEQLKSIRIGTENKVGQILKLIKSIKQGNKDGNSRKKADLIQLTEDVHQQYESLYALYDNLRGEVRRKVQVGDEDDGSPSSTSSSSDEELYYSPKELIRPGESISDFQKVSDDNEQKPETSDVEDTVLKDKLTSASEVKESLAFGSPLLLESGAVIKDVGVEAEHSESLRHKLIVESASLKEKLIEKEEELLSLTKRHQRFEHEKMAQIEQLEGQVAMLKLELESLRTQKRESEEQVRSKTGKTKELREEISRLQSRISEHSASLKKYEQNELQSVSRIDKLMAEANVLKLEAESLLAEKAKLEEQLYYKTQEGAAQVKRLTEELNGLQQKVGSLSSQNFELGLLVERQSQEVSKCLIQRDELREKLSFYEKKETEEEEDLKVHLKDLELEVNSLCSQKSDLEEQMTNINLEACQSRVEKEKLHGKISDLQKTLTAREHKLSELQKKYEDHRNDTSDRITSFQAQTSNLQHELQTLQAQKSQLQLQLEGEKKDSSQTLIQMEKKNIELKNKIADQQRTVVGLEDVVKRLRQENKQFQDKLSELKTNFQAGERKIGEMAGEFRKQFEVNLRILSQRIRIAEQLQIENKDWYLQTRYILEKENKELKVWVEKYELGIRSIKDTSVTANDMLTSLDTMALKFEECAGNFLNRISKVSCELKFVKDWVMRKNKAISHVKEDLECLLVQLDEKEAEILVYREKVWKSENRVRELEKLIKEKEDYMIGLKEEKREAIRQLCVWIDYHRSRSDYYKKTLTDLNVGYRRAAKDIQHN